jgi:hypothetical protein
LWRARVRGKFTEIGSDFAQNPTLGMGRRPKNRAFAFQLRNASRKVTGQRVARFCAGANDRSVPIPKVGFHAICAPFFVKILRRSVTSGSEAAPLDFSAGAILYFCSSASYQTFPNAMMRLASPLNCLSFSYKLEAQLQIGRNSRQHHPRTGSRKSSRKSFRWCVVAVRNRTPNAN